MLGGQIQHHFGSSVGLPLLSLRPGCEDLAMPNDAMSEFWNTRGGKQWVTEAERYDRMLEPIGRRLLAASGLALGERVLDVGCGNGAVTIEVARRVGANGHAVGLDISTPMLAFAQKRAAEAGVDATFVEADAQIGELGGPYDAIVSRFGVMFFDDPTTAFANMASSLRPGGRLAFVCWQGFLNNQWIAVPAGAVFAHVGIPELPKEGEPGPFSFAEKARVEGILHDAGFADIRIEAASDMLVMGSDPDDVVAYFVRDELGRRVLEGKDPDKVEAATAAALEALRPFATTDGVALDSAYWVVTARRG